MAHSIHYILELQLKEDKKKWYVFAQGISPLFYRLEGMQYFSIYKQWVENTEFEKKNLTWKFVRFQQLYKRRIQLKKLVLKHLRKLETGEVTFQELSNRLK
jgi:hypothetical protein